MPLVRELALKHGARRREAVAEEVGEVLPELVEWEEDGRYAKGLHYSGIVPLLVEAVKAQSVTIERQQEELAQLKALVCRDQQEVGPCQ